MLRHSVRLLKNATKASPKFTITNGGIKSKGCLSVVVPQIGNSFRYQSTDAPSASEESKRSSPVEHHEFQAETRKLLDIVTNSIYTDKEVFIRELISNASDALEKVRHLQSVGESIVDPELPFEIRITTDEEKNTLTIEDTGIGMTKAELVENLGTIARSGSKAFLDQLKDSGAGESAEAASGIIGKFGVGFYSAYCVGDKVDVYSRSAVSGSENHVWSSDGTGSYEIATATDEESVSRGCKMVIHLKQDCKEYATAKQIETIIRKYSNFVSFPIILNGETINTVQALWTMDAKDISEEQYTEFYKYVANAFDEPMYRLNFRADAPIELKSLFFVGSSHMEKFGYGRLEPGVSLYSRKVLIERNSNDVLPDWLRFVRGVVDSEDLPLSLSRESMQDSRMLSKIKDVLVRRFLRFLDQQSRNDPEKYDKFFAEFGQFLKEGICSDAQHKDAIGKLLRYESSTLEAGKTTSFDDYISRLTPEQDKIYYLYAPNRELAEGSPYFEGFKKKGLEVLFVYGPIDDFVMNSVGEYNKRKVVSAELLDVGDKDDEKTDKEGGLSQEKSDLLTAWLKLHLAQTVKEVKVTHMLADSPAVITNHESASVRRMMSMINEGQKTAPMSEHVLEINPNHPIMVKLNSMRESDEDLAKSIAEQVYDNAKTQAGLSDDGGRSMIPRLNKLLQKLMETK